MSRTRTRLPLSTLLLCLLSGLFAANLAAKSQETSPSEQTTSSEKEQKSKKQTAVQSDASAGATASGKKSSSKTTGRGSISAEEIASAKASGKVWVNLDSGVHHKSGRWYGKTKNGKFMSEAEAKQAGYRESKRQ